MKKFLALLLSLTLAFSVFSVSASAEESTNESVISTLAAEPDDFVSWTTTEGGYTYTIFDSPSTPNASYTRIDKVGDKIEGNFVIPLELGGRPVTEIGPEAAAGNTKITDVCISRVLRKIDAYAFKDCKSLETLYMTKSGDAGQLVEMGEGAFEGCSKLWTAFIAKSIKTIETGTFKDCTSLTSVMLSESVSKINMYAFEGCTALKTVDLSKALESIGTGAFAGCSKLEEINAAEGGNYLSKDGVLFSKDAATLILYPAGLGEEYSVPYGTKTIGYGAFSGNTDLTEVTLPNGLTSIGESAFEGCKYIKTVVVPSSVTEIGNSAFADCSALKTVTLGSGLKTIGKTAFKNSGITELTLPKALQSISDSAFDGCTSLAQFKMDGLGTSYSVSDGILYDRGKTVLIACPKASSKTVIEIPVGVKAIDKKAFAGCTTVTSVQAPESVVTIGESAFEDCTALKSIDINGKITDIQTKTFSDCSALASVSLPDTLKNIGYAAFNGCDNLTSVYFAGATPKINDEDGGSFSGCASELTFYYISGKSGWKKPVWNTYKTDTYTPESKEDPFEDIEKHWGREDILWAYNQGLFSGMSATEFAPEENMTRAMMVTVLYRMEGQPETTGTSFDDVESGLWYTEAVVWASKNKIVMGMTEKEFAPMDNITREQIAAILYRYAEYKSMNVSAKGDLTKYKDNDEVSDWAETAMSWAVGKTLIQGMDGNNLNPKGEATRAQVAALLHRFS